MSHYVDILAVKIYTNVASLNTDIGLYQVTGENSELRWSEVSLQGTTETYKPNILMHVGDIAHRIDASKGGNTLSINSIDIRIDNTQEIIHDLDTLGIYLNGLHIEIVEFIGTTSDSDYSEVSVIFTGNIEEVNWTEREVIIRAASSLTRKRRTQLATVITENNRPQAGNITGDIIPVTFGSSDPANGIYFKALRTTSVETVMNVESLASGGTSGTNYLNPKMNLFPVSDITGTAPTLTYQIRLGHMDGTALPDGDVFVGKYILVKEGTGEGVYRKIVSASVVGTASTGIAAANLTVEDYFPVDLVYDWDAVADGQSWVQIVDLGREYEVDNAECLGFFDSNSNLLSNAALLYSKKDSDITLLPQYGYDIDTDNTDKNSLIMDPKLFNDDPDKMVSYFILPITDLDLCTDSDLSAWDTSAENWWGLIDKIQDGIYSAATGPDELTSVSLTGDSDDVSDKDPDTYLGFSFHGKQNSSASIYYKVFKFSLPEIPEGFAFDTAYLGIKLWSQCYAAWYEEPGARIMSRGYIGRVTNILSDKKFAERAAAGADLTNMPDFYWVPNEDTNNLDFYRSASPDASDNYIKISGRNTLSICEGADAYNAIEECVIVLHRILSYGNEYDDDTKIYQAVVMLETETDISEVIYV